MPKQEVKSFCYCKARGIQAHMHPWWLKSLCRERAYITVKNIKKCLSRSIPEYSQYRWVHK